MKHTIIILTLLPVLAGPALAYPFTLRPGPAAADAGSQGKPIAANLDADARLEWYSGGNTILKSTGAIISLPMITLPAIPTAQALPISGTVADVDNDGDTDIVRINRWSQNDAWRTLKVYLNDGAGTFTGGYQYDWQIPSSDVGYTTRHPMAAGDFDGDGDMDLALMYFSGRRYEIDRIGLPIGSAAVRWNKNSGLGIFDTTVALQSNYFTAAAIHALDFNGDGRSDVLCYREETTETEGYSYTPWLPIFRSTGGGNFNKIKVPLMNGENLCFGDLNRDGRPDAVDNRGQVYINNITGFIRSGTVTGTLWGEAVIADADEDGRQDLISCSNGNGNVGWLKGNGGTGLSNQDLLGSVGTVASGIAAGDGDGDGDTDFYIRTSGGSSYFLENTAIHREARFSTSSVSLEGISDIEAADISGDGIEDLVGASPASEKLYLFKGEAAGFPGAPEFRYTGGEAPGCLATGDFDKDGDIDVAYTRPGPGTVHLVTNYSVVDNNFASFSVWNVAQIAAIPGARLIAAGRQGLEDGSLDLVIGSATTGKVRWLRNYSSGWSGLDMLASQSPAPAAFTTGNLQGSYWGDELAFVTGGTAAQIKAGANAPLTSPAWTQLAASTINNPGSGAAAAAVMADVSGDCRLETIFAAGTNALYYWQPQDAGAQPVAIDTTTAGAIRAIAPLDWNRDGLTDLFCAHSMGISLYLNGGATWRELGSNIGACDDIVAMDLNRDGLMDAAVSQAGAGKVHWIFNTSTIVTRDNFISPANANGEVHITSAYSGPVGTMEMKNPGHVAGTVPGTLADPNIALTSALVGFYKASFNGSVWIMGAALTAAEVQSVISNASFHAEEDLLGNTFGSAASAQGTLTVSITNQTAATIAPGANLPLTCRISFKQNASAIFPALYVQVRTVSATVLDGASPAHTDTITPGNPVRVILDPLLTSLQNWRKTNFGNSDGTGTRANDADFDKDGVPNIAEYVAGTDPKVGEGAANVANGLYLLSSVTLGQSPQFRLRVSDAAMDDPKLKITVQQNTSLTGSWGTVASRTGTGAWTGLIPWASIPGGGSTAHLFLVSNITPSVIRHYFLRLKLEELP